MTTLMMGREMNSNLRRPRRVVAALAATALAAAACTTGVGEDTADDPDEAAAPDEDTDEDTGEPAEIEPLELTVTTTIGGPDNYHNVPILAYLDAVEEASDGAITYEFFAGGALLGPTEIGAGLRDGVVDLSLLLPLFTPADYDVDTWISNATFAGDAGPPLQTLQRATANLEWWLENEEVLERDFLDQGIRPLTPGVSGILAYNILCTETVDSVASAQGKQVRTPGPAYVGHAEAMGMTSVSLPGAEIFESLQRGVVDCTMVDGPDVIGQSLTDVAGHYTEINLPGLASYMIAMSESTWTDMSDAQREVMVDQLDVYMAALMDDTFGLQHQLATDEEMGIEFHAGDAELTGVIESYQEGLLDQLVDEAPDGLSDPEGLLADFVQRHDVWGDRFTDLGFDDYPTWDAWAADVDDPGSVDVDLWAQETLDSVIRPALLR